MQTQREKGSCLIPKPCQRHSPAKIARSVHANSTRKSSLSDCEAVAMTPASKEREECPRKLNGKRLPV